MIYSTLRWISSLSLIILTVLIGAAFAGPSEKKVKAPVYEVGSDGTRTLLIPADLEAFLLSEFPGYRFPKESELSPEMMQYYFSNLIGVYPSIAWGDFNGDKKKDYFLLIITGDTKWGPMCELVALNGYKNSYLPYRLGEVYNFKDDYVSFNNGKLYKGSYRKNGWYINWVAKDNNYSVQKS